MFLLNHHIEKLAYLDVLYNLNKDLQSPFLTSNFSHPVQWRFHITSVWTGSVRDTLPQDEVGYHGLRKKWKHIGEMTSWTKQNPNRMASLASWPQIRAVIILQSAKALTHRIPISSLSVLNGLVHSPFTCIGAVLSISFSVNFITTYYLWHLVEYTYFLRGIKTEVTISGKIMQGQICFSHFWRQMFGIVINRLPGTPTTCEALDPSPSIY